MFQVKTNTVKIKFVKIPALMMVLLLFPVLAMAQTMPGVTEPLQNEPVGEEELEEFVEAYVGVWLVQAEYSAQIELQLESSVIGAERFYEINEMAEQAGTVEDLPGVSNTEVEDFMSAMGEIHIIQQEMQQAMIDRVVDGGFQVERFNEIIFSLERDQALAKRAGELIEEELEEQGIQASGEDQG